MQSEALLPYPQPSDKQDGELVQSHRSKHLAQVVAQPLPPVQLCKTFAPLFSFSSYTTSTLRCRLTICIELVELTNSFRWQDPNQKTDTEARCLVYLCGPISSYWHPTNSNPQNLNQRCPLQISSQALFLEGSQLHLAAAMQSDSQDKGRKSSKSGLDFSQRPGAHHQIHNQDHLGTISLKSERHSPSFCNNHHCTVAKKLNSCATVTTDAGSPLLIVDWEQPLFYEGSDKTYESQYNQLQR